MKLYFKHKFFIFLINLVSSTWRIKVIGEKPEKPSIIVFWHRFMLPAWKFFTYANPFAVVSQSNDGEILSAILKKWNFELIRGSSSRGGKEVLDNITNQLPGNYVLMTPDGPRGPIYKFKPGAVIAAHRTGADLCLCGVNISWKLVFNKAWDSFIFPLPFARITLNFASAIQIPATATREEIDALINNCEYQLNILSNINNGRGE